MNASVLSLPQELAQARSLLEQGNGAAAEDSYRRVVALAPENAEALNFLATRAMTSGRGSEAVGLMLRARALEPENPHIGCNLGLAYLITEQAEPARETFAHVLEREPTFFLARLNYARALEMLGREDEALTQYFAAIMRAQTQGRWLNDATTPPALRQLVKHGMNFAQVRRKRLFEGVLDRVGAQHGGDTLQRVRKCLQVFLGELPLFYADTRQRPKFLFFPDLPTSPYFARELFPWYAMLEDNFEAIHGELLEVLGSSRGIEPFLQFHSRQEAQGYLGGAEQAAWDAFFFYRHGTRYDENCARCPRTAAILDALPTLVHIREHAPEVCFSLLTPGAHILPHRGVTNTRLVTHFPLIVPGDCALKVGGEEHVWKPGRCITFDDTFEHEAWNRSEQTRVVMLLDVWNPHLTEPERGAVAALVEAIGDFNRAAEVQEIHNH